MAFDVYGTNYDLFEELTDFISSLNSGVNGVTDYYKSQGEFTIGGKSYNITLMHFIRYLSKKLKTIVY